MSNTSHPIDIHAAIIRALGETNGAGHRAEAVIPLVDAEIARRDQRIDQLTEERDRARRWAEALEQQLHREREITATPVEFDEAGEKL